MIDKLLVENIKGNRLPKIISKIESREGLANIDEIIPLSDGILIDRGDLSREISISRIPIATKAILNKCIKHDTPCYVASNVLDSMITSSLPSRAEISDLYNLYDGGVSGIVLSAEVSIGKNPKDSVHIVRHMHKMYKAQKDSLLALLPKSEMLGDLPNNLKEWL